MDSFTFITYFSTIFKPSFEPPSLDRKKDLVKLQHGEYIALSRVETVLKMCPLVEQICVIAHPNKSNVVALVVPNESNLMALAKKVGVTDATMKDLCVDDKIVAAVQKEITAHGSKGNLSVKSQKADWLCRLCHPPHH